MKHINLLKKIDKFNKLALDNNQLTMLHKAINQFNKAKSDVIKATNIIITYIQSRPGKPRPKPLTNKASVKTINTYLSNYIDIKNSKFTTQIDLSKVPSSISEGSIVRIYVGLIFTLNQAEKQVQQTQNAIYQQRAVASRLLYLVIQGIRILYAGLNLGNIPKLTMATKLAYLRQLTNQLQPIINKKYQQINKLTEDELLTGITATKILTETIRRLDIIQETATNLGINSNNISPEDAKQEFNAQLSQDPKQVYQQLKTSGEMP